MKVILPILAMLLMLAGCAGSAPAPQEETHPRITHREVSMEEAIAMMESESGYLILDVRTPSEFAEKHIPGAMNIANEAIGTEEIPELPDKNQLILVYCRSGNRSKQASRKLADLGYCNVVEFGGINSWPGPVVSGNE